MPRTHIDPEILLIGTFIVSLLCAIVYGIAVIGFIMIAGALGKTLSGEIVIASWAGASLFSGFFITLRELTIHSRAAPHIKRGKCDRCGKSAKLYKAQKGKKVSHLCEACLYR